MPGIRTAREWGVIVAAAAIAALAAPGLAGASEISGTDRPNATMKYYADAGERNRVSFQGLPGADVVQDSGARSIRDRTSAACVIQGQLAACVVLEADWWLFDLGDKNDTFSSSAGAARVFGGPGADSLSVAHGRLEGGSGDDVLEARHPSNFRFGSGAHGQFNLRLGITTHFFGDDGDDVIKAANDVSDLLVCGPGTDKALVDRVDTLRVDAECERVIVQ